MRTVSRWVLVATVACAVAGAASAQEQRRQRGQRPGGGQPGGGFGGGMMMRGGGAALLSNDGVQKELKLTDEQKTKVKEFTEAQQAKMREMFQGGGFDREKMQEAMKEGREKSEKFVKETLNADQQKRYKEINYQVQLQTTGPAVFANEDVQKALKLSDDQKDKLKSMGEEMRKDTGELMRDLRGGGDAAAEARKKLQAVTKEYTTKAVDTLSDEQKKAWKDLTGAPFEFKMDAGTGGERRRPGGEGGGDTPRRRRPGGGDNPPPAGGNTNRPRNNDPPPA